MTTVRNQVWYIVKPGRLFLVVLGIIFLVESAVMLLLPSLLPKGATASRQAVVDACLLTGTLAPMLWVLVIRPLRELAQTRTELLSRVLTAQEEERGRIARDLHDSLGQSLTCVTVGLRAVEESVADEAMRRQLQELRRIGADAHEEIRRLATGLRPILLDDLGLAAALERYFDDIAKVNGVRTTFDFHGLEQTRLPQVIETTLFRIVQEASSNAVRHGAATELRLFLRRVGRIVELEIQDNGCGFDPQVVQRRDCESQSFGLCSMRERVALLSGTFDLKSQPGTGTTIAVQLPLPKTERTNGEDPNIDR